MKNGAGTRNECILAFTELHGHDDERKCHSMQKPRCPSGVRSDAVGHNISTAGSDNVKLLIPSLLTSICDV